MKRNSFKVLVLSAAFILTLSIGVGAVTATTGKNFLTSRNGCLYDASGNKVRLTGVNWFGFETAMMMPHGIWSRDTKSMLMQMKSLGYNSVRFPWTNAMLRPGKSIQINSYGTDPFSGVSPMNKIESTFTSPIQLLEQILKYCQELNLKVILDSHARKPDNYMGETIWYDETCSEQQWIDDWVFLTKKFKDYDCFIACDLDNEPHGRLNGATSATWGNSNPLTDWNKAAERCGNAILAENPNMLIFVEGVEAYEATSYWWGGNLQGAKKYPVVLNIPSQLVYSPHEYGPTVHLQEWFNDPKFPENMPALWDDYFGFLQTSGTSHLYVGEYGIRSLGGKDEIWIKKWLEYMGNSYSWAFWCWNPNSGDTGGLLDDQWTSIVKWKVDLIAPYLAPEIPNGKSISTSTSSPEIDSIEMSIFPNPVAINSGFKVNLNRLSTGRLSIFNSTGVECYTQSFVEQKSISVDSELIAGIYILKSTIGDTVDSKKFIVK